MSFATVDTYQIKSGDGCKTRTQGVCAREGFRSHNRTLTVGPGIAPSLLSLPKLDVLKVSASARGLSAVTLVATPLPPVGSFTPP